MARSRSNHQLSLPPQEVQRLDLPVSSGESPRPIVGLPEFPELSLEMAKAQIGNALKTAIRGDSLKEYGDPSHVNRVCGGEIPGPLARAWQRRDRRRALVLALAEESDLFDVRVSIDERRRA